VCDEESSVLAQSGKTEFTHGAPPKFVLSISV
jgi:hypothetical protein